MAREAPPAGRCPICCGERVVRLPTRRPMSVLPPRGPSTAAVEDASRVYPCPECGDVAALDRVGVVSHHAQVDLRAPAEYAEYARRASAQSIARGLLEGGFVRFQEREDPDGGLMMLRATVGVVHPGVVAAMEQRAGACARAVAEAVAREATLRLTAESSREWIHRSVVDREARRAAEDVLGRRPWEWST